MDVTKQAIKNDKEQMIMEGIAIVDLDTITKPIAATLNIVCKLIFFVLKKNKISNKMPLTLVRFEP